MISDLRGQLCVKPQQHYVIIAAEFNGLITSRLADGAVEALVRHGANEKQISNHKHISTKTSPLV